MSLGGEHLKYPPDVTLCLPIIRTSVDHGTALDLAGTAAADPGSLQTALQLAIEMSAQRVQHDVQAEIIPPIKR